MIIRLVAVLPATWLCPSFVGREDDVSAARPAGDVCHYRIQLYTCAHFIAAPIQKLSSYAEKAKNCLGKRELPCDIESVAIVSLGYEY